MAWIEANFFSEALGMCVKCNVLLPVQGPRRKTEAPRRPVLWLLHGSCGNCDDFIRFAAIERHTTGRGLAVVMPSAGLSSYLNMQHGMRYYDYVAKELPEKLCTMFPLSDKREHNFIAGISMGGRGALTIGLANPDRYAAIGCFSAGLDIPENIFYQRMVVGDGVATGVGDIRASARKAARAKHPPRIYHVCGTEDRFLPAARNARDFFTAFPENPFRYTYEEGPGDHDWAYWNREIPRFLDELPVRASPGAWR